MVSSLSVITASADFALSQRIVAVMATLGVENPERKASELSRELVVTPFKIGDQDSSLATVHEYATAVRAQAVTAREEAIRAAEAAHPVPPEPGADATMLTDQHIRLAIVALAAKGRLTLSD